eukprot:gene10355-biopygen16785
MEWRRRRCGKQYIGMKLPPLEQNIGYYKTHLGMQFGHFLKRIGDGNQLNSLTRGIMKNTENHAGDHPGMACRGHRAGSTGPPGRGRAGLGRVSLTSGRACRKHASFPQPGCVTAAPDETGNIIFCGQPWVPSTTPFPSGGLSMRL